MSNRSRFHVLFVANRRIAAPVTVLASTRARYEIAVASQTLDTDHSTLGEARPLIFSTTGRISLMRDHISSTTRHIAPTRGNLQPHTVNL